MKKGGKEKTVISLFSVPRSLIPSIPTNNKISNKSLSFLFIFAFRFPVKGRKETDVNEKGSI